MAPWVGPAVGVTVVPPLPPLSVVDAVLVVDVAELDDGDVGVGSPVEHPAERTIAAPHAAAAAKCLVGFIGPFLLRPKGSDR